MKAADARRQRFIQKKRNRYITTSHNQHDPRFHLAQRLLSTVNANSANQPTHEAIEDHMDQFSQLQAELDTLQELKTWTAHFVELQMQWVECGARLDSTVALRIWDRMDEIARCVASAGDPKQQLAVFHKELPAFIDRVVKTVKKTVTRKPLSGGSNNDHNHSHRDPLLRPQLALSLSSSLQPPPLVELTHQWLPRVLRDICASVERDAADGRCRPLLVAAARRLLSVIHVQNPYACFGVLYRPPPSETSETAQAWVLHAAPHAASVAHLLHHDFDGIYNIARWMEAPQDSTFWQSFDQLIALVRHVAVAFHHVMLHLYATAMQRQDPHATAHSVALEIADAYSHHTSFALQTSGYGLAKWLQSSSDPVLRETYHWFPEVLVYVDQWRHEYDVYEHGFAPDAKSRDFEIGVNKWETSKSWLAIAHHAKQMVQTWRKARVGTQPLTFSKLGRLEKDIKYRLCEITDLLYKQNIAKWTTYRKHHTRVRLLTELQIMEQDPGIQPFSLIKPDAIHAASKHAAAATVYPRKEQIFFRPPTVSARATAVAAKVKGSPAAAAKAASTQMTMEQPAFAPVDEDSIFKWTDNEIDAHEQETERVYELQGDLLLAQDKLTMPPLLRMAQEEPTNSHSHPQNQSQDRPDLYYTRAMGDDVSVSRGLASSCRRLTAVAHEIVAHGEEIALHGAAAALIQRPSLRTVNADDDELEDAVRASVSRLLDLLDRPGSSEEEDPKAVSTVAARQMAVEALALLRRVQQQQIA